MAYVSYTRPISKVGFRLLGATKPAHAAALSGIGSLGDDTTTLIHLGFTSAQVAQINSAHESGALSDAGYNALISGFITPADLADFLAADPGAVESTTFIPGVPNWELMAFGAAAVLLLVLGSMRR
jgi:hypothetical protein